MQQELVLTGFYNNGKNSVIQQIRQIISPVHQTRLDTAKRQSDAKPSGSVHAFKNALIDTCIMGV